MKGLLAVGCAFALLTGFLFSLKADGWEAASPEWDQLQTSAKACVIIEAQTGRVLGGHNIHDRLPMASTTKIMSAMLALEEPDLDEYFLVDTDAIQVEGSSMGLVEGDQVTLRDLIYGMLLPSGNDAANAAAVRVAGSVPDFVERMNQRAEELSLEDTHFVTPSGLDAEGHYSTAYDMAMLTAKAMENHEFREICCLSSAQVRFGNPPYSRWLKNYNKLLTMYPYCVGVKTGFTENAYRCLVSAAEKDGIRLICVTLNCGDDWAVHQQLYQRYFEELERKELADILPKTVPLASPAMMEDGSVVEELPVLLEGPGFVPARKGEEVTCHIVRDPMVMAPVSKGAVVGEAVVSLDGEPWFSWPIFAKERLLPIENAGKGKSIIDRLQEFIIQLL